MRDDSDGPGYRVDQTGFFIGTDRRLTRRTYGGVFAGYSAPKLSADDYSAESDVFTVGMLGGLRCDNCWDVRSWAVFGYENTRMNRGGSSGSDLFGKSIYGYACLPNGLDGDSWSGGGGAYRGKSDGWTLATGLEVGRLWCCRWNRYCDLGWRPFVGIDYEQATQNGFDENGSGEFAIQYQKSTFSRTLLRTGISLTASGYAFDVTGRAMYTCLLAGDESPTSTAILPAMLPDPYTLDGANCGRHFFSAGLDATFWLNEKRSRFLTTTYEASMGRRSTAQTVTLAFVQRF